MQTTIMKLTTEQLKDMGYVESRPGLFTRVTEKGVDNVRVEIPPPPPKRIRQSSKPLLNNLEQKWLSVLQQQRDAIIYAQSMRFKLANGIWYKPDFLVFHGPIVTAYECKGPHAFRGGFENLKVAAHQYPNIKWVLVWVENGMWREQVVLP